METEAYLGPDDPACHAWRGRRHALHLGIWSPPHSWYVYRSYGIHWCLNVTTRDGAAVLIRAVRPLEGLATMHRRRGDVPARRLADGPGKLTQAFAITGAEDGTAITADAALRLEGYDPAREPAPIRITPRIGIARAVEWPLRFLLEE